VHLFGFITKNVDRIFIIGASAWRRLGEHVTLDKKFYNLLFKQEAVETSVTATFSFLSHSSRWTLVDKQYLWYIVII